VEAESEIERLKARIRRMKRKVSCINASSPDYKKKSEALKRHSKSMVEGALALMMERASLESRSSKEYSATRSVIEKYGKKENFNDEGLLVSETSMESTSGDTDLRSSEKKADFEATKEALRRSQRTIELMSLTTETLAFASHFKVYSSVPATPVGTQVYRVSLSWVDLRLTRKDDVHMEINVVNNDGLLLGNSCRSKDLGSPLYIVAPKKRKIDRYHVVIQVKHLKRKSKNFWKRSTISWAHTELKQTTKETKGVVEKDRAILHLLRKPVDYSLDKTVKRLGCMAVTIELEEDRQVLTNLKPLRTSLSHGKLPLK